MPSLLTISIYDLHHIVGRFIRLYRQVQVVSDCLTFACSILCCQCWAMLPDNPNNPELKPSHEGFMFLPQHVIDARKAGGDPLKENLYMDFCPVNEVSEEVQEKCMEFCKRVNTPKIVDISIDSGKPVQNATCHMEQVRVFPNLIASVTTQGDEIPATHTKNPVSKLPPTASRASRSRYT